jgi:hypothetical protein
MERRAQMMAVALAALTAVLAGCGDSSSVLPTAPTSTQPPAPEPTVAGERWNLTTTLKSFTGPEACNVIMKARIGESFSWLVTIERSGDSVHLIVADADDPSDRDEYEGTVVEDVLMAAIKGRSGRTVCGGSMVEVFSEAHVSGRFSGDGRSLTAEELTSYQFSFGELARFYYDWNATRQ